MINTICLSIPSGEVEGISDAWTVETFDLKYELNLWDRFLACLGCRQWTQVTVIDVREGRSSDKIQSAFIDCKKIEKIQERALSTLKKLVSDIDYKLLYNDKSNLFDRNKLKNNWLDPNTNYINQSLTNLFGLLIASRAVAEMDARTTVAEEFRNKKAAIKK